MIILMARPWKHPKNGTYYYRGRVPADLAKVLKGKQIGITVGDEPAVVRFGETCKVSLRTKSNSEAKARHSAVEAQLQKFWDGTRRGAVSLSFEQVCALAGELYRETLANHESEPGSPGDWEFSQGLLSDALWWFERDEDGKPLNPKQGEREVSNLTDVDRFLTLRGLKLTPACHRQFVEQAGGALWRAYGVLSRRADGDYAPDENAKRFPVWRGIQAEHPRSDANGLLTLLEAWATEVKPASSTLTVYGALRGILNEHRCGWDQAVYLYPSLSISPQPCHQEAGQGN